MYGIGGETDLTEHTLDHLSGYRNSRPVRIGNGAFDQHQHDVWGMLLDAVDDPPAPRRPDPARRSGAGICYLVDQAIERVPEPDQGIWEMRGDPQHFVASKVMCWVAVDRGLRLARERDDDELHRTVAGGGRRRCRPRSSTRGVDDRGVFTQHYGTKDLDASNLLIPIMGFLPGDDERVRATVLAIADELTKDGLVLRYRVDTTDDGLSGEEGTFTICSFWLVSALTIIGEVDRARALFEKLLSFAGPLHLYAEEIDATTGQHLGQLPAGVHPPRADRRRSSTHRHRGSGRLTGRMRVFTTSALEDPRDVRATYPRLEEIGYDGVFSFEAKHDPFVALAVAAEHTTRVQLGTAIAIAFARTPMNLAYLGNDLQLVTGGRFVLGLGSQVRPHIVHRYGAEWSEPARRMHEIVRAVECGLHRMGDRRATRVRGRLLPPHLDDPRVRSGSEPVRTTAGVRRRIRAADGGGGGRSGRRADHAPVHDPRVAADDHDAGARAWPRRVGPLTRRRAGRVRDARRHVRP